MSGGGTRVQLDEFQARGTTGQFFKRDLTLGRGGAWVTISPFTLTGQVAANFGSGPPATTVVTIAVNDGQVTAGSVITANVQIGSARSSDELEMDQVDVYVGLIVPSVGFTLVVCGGNVGSVPHGAYLINYARA